MFSNTRGFTLSHPTSSKVLFTDKCAEPAGLGSEHLVENHTTLRYTIRFQNTGTDTAFNVRVFDEIDPNSDLSTLQVLGSSHPMHYALDKRNLKFYFDNILLPDSNKNYDLSNGFLAYSIKPKKDIDGKKILNTADIYFDYNAPISTNTTFHKIGIISNPPLVYLSNSLAITPNPTNGNEVELKLHIANEGDYKLIISDMTGKKLREISDRNYISGIYSYKCNLSALQQGIYLVSLLAKEKNVSVTQKLLINK